MGANRWVVGLVLGLLMMGLGLYMIGAKANLWGLTQQLYALIAVTAERTRLWDMFTTTIGLGLLLMGAWTAVASWARRQR